MSLRSDTLRLAASLPVGDPTRQAILAALTPSRMAKKWIQDAIKDPGRVHRYLGIPEDEDIPAAKIDAAIAKLKAKENKTKDEKSLMSALLLAKRFQSKMASGKVARVADVAKAQLRGPAKDFLKHIRFPDSVGGEAAMAACAVFSEWAAEISMDPAFEGGEIDSTLLDEVALAVNLLRKWSGAMIRGEWD